MASVNELDNGISGLIYVGNPGDAPYDPSKIGGTWSAQYSPGPPGTLEIEIDMGTGMIVQKVQYALQCGATYTCNPGVGGGYTVVNVPDANTATVTDTSFVKVTCPAGQPTFFALHIDASNSCR